MVLKPASLPLSGSRGEDADWKRELAAAFTRPQDLLETLGLDPDLLPGALMASRGFRLLVPRGFAALMTPGDPHDPLLRQVLPLADELALHPGFDPDPVGDLSAIRAQGLIQKYRGRALLIATGACAVHCRYCFRREFPYGGGSIQPARATPALEHLAADPHIHEVILSGGDPLLLDDEDLAGLMARLEAIPHLKRLRLHTRLPVVLPERITARLCDLLGAGRLKAVVVVHANHPGELGPAALAGIARLRTAHVALLNQSVLLRGVNDDPQVLSTLSEALFAAGVLPYYLHLLDRVAGAAHFEVDEVKALALVDALRRELPGYLVPRLVREEAGRPFKTPVQG